MRHIQRRALAGAAAVLVAAGCTVGSESAPPPEDASALPGGYQMRLDSDRSDPGEFQVEPEDSGFHITTGPAGIAWRDEDRAVSGDFHAEATFVQFNAPIGYREAYGVFVGGSDLDGPDQEYTYLLVRPTGDFLVKRRVGETTETLVDWTPHEAVARVVEEGDEPTNVVAIEVVGGETRFLVNEVVVHTLPSPQVRPYGIAGFRANHRLDIHVGSWSLRTGAES